MTASNESPYNDFIVYSDWDDTLAAAGGSDRDSFWERETICKFAGSDQSLRHGTVYPGIEELQKSLTGARNYENIILSANPKSGSGQKEDKQNDLNEWWQTYRKTPSDGKPLQIWQVLSGDILDFDSYEEFADTKMKHMCEQPSYGKPRIFFGDNGQGDVLAAHRALNQSPAPCLDFGFIHYVTDDPRHTLDDDSWGVGHHYVIEPQTTVKEGQHGIYMYMNYVQAAYIAQKLNLIDENQYTAIEKAYYRDWEFLPEDDKYEYSIGIHCQPPTDSNVAVIPEGVMQAESGRGIRGCEFPGTFKMIPKYFPNVVDHEKIIKQHVQELREKLKLSGPLKAEGEDNIGYKDLTSEPMWVQYECDQQHLKEETSKSTNALIAAYREFIAEGSHTDEETKEYMYSLVDKDGKMTKIAANGGFLQEAVPKCIDELVYVSIMNFGYNGWPNAFMQAAGLDFGWQIVVSGSPKSPNYDMNDDVCFGKNCGCTKDYCWSYCSFGHQWCYTTKGKSQDHNYVSCSKNVECESHWSCGGPCTV